VKLLDRSPRGVVTTAYGQALLRRGGAAFDELRQGINEIELLSDPAAGEVNIGCPESIATILPPVIDAFRRLCPRASLGIDYEIATTFASRLRDRALPEDRANDDFKLDILFDDDLVVAAGAQSRWARRRRIDLAELHQADWIMPGPDSWAHRVTTEAFRDRGLDMPRIGVRSLSGHLQANLLARSDFVTVVARSVLNFYRQRFALKELPIKLPAPPWPVAIVTLKDRTLSPVAGRFIECARKGMVPINAKP
jgi:DNA-binding transcriptional LysR family regulator